MGLMTRVGSQQCGYSKVIIDYVKITEKIAHKIDKKIIIILLLVGYRKNIFLIKAYHINLYVYNTEALQTSWRSYRRCLLTLDLKC